MRALAKTILILLLLVPFSVAAKPGGPGKKNKNKKNGPEVVVVETKGKKSKHKGSEVVVVETKGKKKGKKKGPEVIVVETKGKKKGRKHGSSKVVLVVEEPRPVVVHVVGRKPMSFERLVRRIDRARGAEAKLFILSEAAFDRHFTVKQTRRILREFRSERARLEALKILRTRIVDRGHLRSILRSFESRSAKRSAAFMLFSV